MEVSYAAADSRLQRENSLCSPLLRKQKGNGKDRTVRGMGGNCMRGVWSQVTSRGMGWRPAACTPCLVPAPWLCRSRSIDRAPARLSEPTKQPAAGAVVHISILVAVCMYIIWSPYTEPDRSKGPCMIRPGYACMRRLCGSGIEDPIEIATPSYVRTYSSTYVVVLGSPTGWPGPYPPAAHAFERRQRQTAIISFRDGPGRPAPTNESQRHSIHPLYNFIRLNFESRGQPAQSPTDGRIGSDRMERGAWWHFRWFISWRHVQTRTTTMLDSFSIRSIHAYQHCLSSRSFFLA